MIYRSVLILFCCFVVTHLFTQIDFNNYRNLNSAGDIPNDFIEKVYEKIDQDIQSNESKFEEKDEKIFLEGAHYTVNDLLHSGMTVYGDEVTTYINKIVDKLLEKDLVLRSKLRFYTIKSNEANALSTFQGVIFVTTGLISQLDNEAQLAYILSHEIVHYTEQHSIESFDFHKKNKKNSDKIHVLSKFSRRNEIEADRKGVKLFNEAGYSIDALSSTFDVLLYSYLPFEELDFPRNYLNSKLLKIPDALYVSENFPIKAVDDVDDSKSSHPNIKNRKEFVAIEVQYFDEWGNSLFLLGEDQFKYIQTICRFESIRTDIMEAHFDKALYSIFILEKQYPNSIYLKRMKAKAWLGISQYLVADDFRNRLPVKEDLQGGIGKLQSLFKAMTKNQILTLSIRIIQDLKSENEEDVFIRFVWERMIKTLSKEDSFDLNKYFDKTKEDSDSLAPPIGKDSVVISNSSIPIINVSDSNSVKNDLTSSEFHLYGLSDLKKSDEFMKKYSFYKEEHERIKKENEEYGKLMALSGREFRKANRKRKKEKKKMELNEQKDSEELNSFIYLEPIVYSYKKKRADRIKSEKLQIDYTNSISSISKKLDFDVQIFSKSTLSIGKTEDFNQRSTLMAYFSELIENDGVEVFPTDYNLLLSIQEKYHTDKIMLSSLEHEKKIEISQGFAAAIFLFFPIGVASIPFLIMKRDVVTFTTLVVDISKGEIVQKNIIESHEPVNAYTINARVYDLLRNLKK